MTTLLTGASGFVGAAVLRHLLEAGHDIRALVRTSSDRRNLNGLNVDVIEGDMMDFASLQHAARGCKALFHVAADYRLWTRNPEEMIRTNVTGSRNVLVAAAEAGVTRMVYTSSVAVLGTKQDGPPADENTPVALEDMIGPYKRSKFLAEKEIKKLIIKQKLPVIIVNPSVPVGPRDIKPTPTGRMIAEAVAGHVPAYVNTGLNIAHVNDVAKGHLLAFNKGKIGERYILGGDNLTLREILSEISHLTGRKPPRLSLPHGLIIPLAYVAEAWALLRRSDKEPFITVDGLHMARKRMFFSSTKAEHELGYQHRPATIALSDAVKWFRYKKIV